MNPMQIETSQSVEIKKIEGLYHKHMTLGREAQIKGDRVLSENYYQHAEYYLQLMNELNSCLPMPRPSAKKSSSAIIKEIIEDLNLERVSSKEDSNEHPHGNQQDIQMTQSVLPPQQPSTVIALGGNLHRKRRGIFKTKRLRKD